MLLMRAAGEPVNGDRVTQPRGDPREGAGCRGYFIFLAFCDRVHIRRPVEILSRRLGLLDCNRAHLNTRRKRRCVRSVFSPVRR